MTEFFVLTQSSTFIIGDIAKLFGWIMDYIYNFFSNMGIESLGITIIVFTALVRTLMLPLAFQQQKQMKEMSKIQPELKAIQDKYKNRKDPDSQRQMQAETGQLYQKHGVHPFGGCLPLLIQMPIIFALFQVLRNVPSYIESIKELFSSIAISVANAPGAETVLTGDTYKAAMSQVKDFVMTEPNKIIDLLGKFSSENWSQLKLDLPSIADAITPYVNKIMDINYFFGINLADKPNLLSIGILIPILNVVVQFLVSKTTTPTGGDTSQAGTQKTMMYTMPLITAIFVIQMPAGLGLYWLASSVFQFVQQYVINRHLHGKEQKA